MSSSRRSSVTSSSLKGLAAIFLSLLPDSSGMPCVKRSHEYEEGRMGLSSDDMLGVMMAVNTYPIAVDSLSWGLFDREFDEDVVADFGGGARCSDLAALKRDFDIIHRPFKTTQHYTGNHVITGSGDTAHCLSYVRARFTRDLDSGPD